MKLVPDPESKNPNLSTATGAKEAEGGRGSGTSRILGFLISSPRRRWWFGLLLIAATIIAYQPAWHAGFVWDDDKYVTENPLLSASNGLRRIWFSLDSPSQYFPLTYTVFRLEWQLWGLNATGYHWINLLLHAANALLVWRLVYRLGVPGAWLAAALFALHPVQVESVAWISELKSVLSLFFILLALLAWIKFIEERPGRWWFYSLALSFHLLALFSKTTACTLPATLLLMLWLNRKPIDRFRLVQVAPFVIFGLGMGLLAMWWEHSHQGTQGKLFSFSLLDRVLIASHAAWFYAGKLLWPVNLTFSYPRWTINPANPLAYGWLAAGGVLGVAIYFARRRAGRGFEVAALFYLATLAPTLGFVMLYTFRYSFVADHYQYAASIGPLALAAAGISKLFRSFKMGQPFREPVFCGTLLLMLGVLTWRQCGMYSDPETLWRATLTRNPASGIAHNNLGNALAAQGKWHEAIQHYERALQLQPDDAEAHYNLGCALAAQGEPYEAIQSQERALQLKPDDANFLNNLGCALAAQGKLDEAIQYFERALQLKPDDAAAHNNLGDALAAQGKLDEAIRHFKRAVQLKPDDANFLNNLGTALVAQGKLQEAIQYYERALQLKPDDAQVHFNLGNALAAQGKWEEAISHYERALQLKPDDVNFLNNLGSALAAQGKWEEAIEHFKRVLQLKPDYAEAQNNLARALEMKNAPPGR